MFRQSQKLVTSRKKALSSRKGSFFFIKNCPLFINSRFNSNQNIFLFRMKLFYYSEKESKFVDRGIGNLYLKPISDGEATQLIIRADNKLANILLNVKLNKACPVNKISAKDVSYLCIPNPPIAGVDSKLPCKFLFKVKTEEDALELVEKLNEHKK